MSQPEPRISEDIRFRRIEDEAVVINQAKSQILVVNDVGARILELLRDGRSRLAVVEVIAREYDVDRRRIEGDVEPYLDELSRQQVINA